MTEPPPDDDEDQTEDPTESASLSVSPQSVALAVGGSNSMVVDLRVRRLMTSLPILMGPIAFTTVVTAGNILYAWVSLAVFWLTALSLWLFHRPSTKALQK